MLVAPVLHQGAAEHDVHLPRGAAWTNVWTGQTHTGGVRVTVAAPLDKNPLFTRGNAQLPIVG